MRESLAMAPRCLNSISDLKAASLDEESINSKFGWHEVMIPRGRGPYTVQCASRTSQCLCLSGQVRGLSSLFSSLASGKR